MGESRDVDRVGKPEAETTWKTQALMGG